MFSHTQETRESERKRKSGFLFSFFVANKHTKEKRQKHTAAKSLLPSSFSGKNVDHC